MNTKMELPENIKEFEVEFNKKVRKLLKIIIPIATLLHLVCVIKVITSPVNWFLTVIVFLTFLLFCFYTYRILTYQEDEN